MQGMGQGSHADDEDWDALVLEWIRIGAVSPAVHESLQHRFMRCRARRPVRKPPRSAYQPDERGDNRNGHEDRPGRRHGREGSKIATAR
jgi:hypothetical protein